MAAALTSRRHARATSACNPCANAPLHSAAASACTASSGLERSCACPSLCACTTMDELQRLVDLFNARAASSAKSKLDVLMDLERVRDPRVVPFLLQLLADRQES